jgi:hypothetical protein
MNVDLIGVTFPEIKLEVRGNISLQIPLELGLHNHIIKLALNLIHGLLIDLTSLDANNTTHRILLILVAIELRPLNSQIALIIYLLKLSPCPYIGVGYIEE